MSDHRQATDRWIDRLRGAELFERIGHVVEVRGALIEARGPAAGTGEQCLIDVGSQKVVAEVVGFHAGGVLLMPCSDATGVVPGARVSATGLQAEIPVGPTLLGRVIDAMGKPLDGGPEIVSAVRRGLRGSPPEVMRRQRIKAALTTGIKAIDGVLTLGKGQRVGVFAGSGVGKSTLLAMMARGTKARVKVIALVGERSREVREFVEDQLGPEGLSQAVVVAAAASEPAVVRLRAAYAATTIAEHFRDEGDDVLLIMDSLTRFAMARREVGLAAGEPPTARGYTPSVFAELPALCERAGNGVGEGSITGIYTVLVEGDDLNEPVSDAIRGMLDGHIVLSRELAHGGRFPAIDVLKSVSRLRTMVTDEHEQADVQTLATLLSTYERNRPLIELGAYKPGINELLDRAVAAMPGIERFLSQAVSESFGEEATRTQLRCLVGGKGAEHVTA